MLGSWWFLWMVFMFVFLVPPLGYGWGYRGWGAPYPRFVQQRRGRPALAGVPVGGAVGGPPGVGGLSNVPHHLSWGWGGDFVWIVLAVGVFWAVSAMWWR